MRTPEGNRSTRVRASARNVVTLAALATMLLACGGDDETYLVVTVDRRPAVHDITKLVVVLSNAGSMRTDSLTLSSAEFPVTFSISAPGRTGDIGIAIDGLDAMDTLQGRGFATAQLSEDTANVMLDSADFVVNALYANNQFLSNDFEAVGLQLAAISDGTWTAAFREDCTQCSILARRFDSTGKPVRSELAAGETQFPVNSPTTLTTSGSIPAVAAGLGASALTTLVIWDQFDGGGLGNVACRSFNDKGAAIPGQLPLVADSADVVTVSPLSNGNFVVTYQMFMTTNIVKAVIVKPDCTIVGNAYQLSTTSGSFGARRSHAAANGATIMYTWIVDGDVKMRTGSLAGLTGLTGEMALIAKTASQEVDHVRIAPWQSGFAVAVRWAAATGTGPGKLEVYRVSVTGALMGTPILITDKSGSDFASDKAFGLAQRSDGALMVAWHQCETGPGSCDVYGRILRPTGVPVGDPYVIATSTVSDQVNPSIIALDNMSFVAAWNDSSQLPPDPSGSSVRARILYPPYDDARGVQGATCGAAAPGAPSCGEGLACAMGSDNVQRCYVTCTPPSCPGGGTCSTVDAITSACTF
jgi:hypothetical protein